MVSRGADDVGTHDEGRVLWWHEVGAPRRRSPEEARLERSTGWIIVKRTGTFQHALSAVRRHYCQS